MKTTVDLPETLLEEVRIVAGQRGWTVRVVFEESLRAFLNQNPPTLPTAFRLDHTIVGGNQAPDMTFSEMLAETDPNRLRNLQPESAQ